jgi:SAM-dependent methyltransferase
MKQIYIHDEIVHNINSPKIIVPQIMKLLHPKSVLDVGCGIGTWLKAFKDCGVIDVIGIDGDYVDRTLLNKYISNDEFLGFDLTKSFNLGRKFDLAISLEVIEHLPKSAALIFIDSLCRHSDTILFSGAIPNQGGQNHLNEQWQSYWSKIFELRGYNVYDPIRNLIWNDSNIEPWYKQNILIYSKVRLNLSKPLFLDVIHPDYFEHRNNRISSLELLINRIRIGKAGLFFGFKISIYSIIGGFFRSTK